MIKPPIKRKVISKTKMEFFEGDVLLARVSLQQKKWVVSPTVQGYAKERCDSQEEMVYLVNSLADRRTMIQLRKNIEGQLADRGLTHLDIYRILKIQRKQYFDFLDVSAARGPTLKTLRNIATVLGCTVADLVEGV